MQDGSYGRKGEGANKRSPAYRLVLAMVPDPDSGFASATRAATYLPAVSADGQTNSVLFD